VGVFAPTVGEFRWLANNLDGRELANDDDDDDDDDDDERGMARECDSQSLESILR
jgi:hypothetical protein